MDPTSENMLKMVQSMLKREGYMDISLKDFDRLTSQQMIRILSLVVSQFEPESTEITLHEKKTSTLLHFGQLGGGQSGGTTYDSTPDYVYAAVKKYFPEGNNLLDMSVILLPQQNPVRTKQVIVYLMGLVLFSDQIIDEFQVEWDRLNAENKQRNELCNEIDLIKQKIAENILERQQKENQKPKLEAEVADIENALLEEQGILAKLELVEKMEKQNYDINIVGNHKLAAKLQSLDEEKASLENQIVKSAPELIDELKQEQHQLQKETHLRETLGEELKQVRNKEQFIMDMIDRSQAAVQKFEMLIDSIQVDGENLNLISRFQSQCKEKQKSIDDLKKTENESALLLKRSETQRHNRLRIDQQKWDTMAELIKTSQEKIKKAQSMAKEREFAIAEIEACMRDKAPQIEKIESKIKEMQHFIKVEMPRQAAILNQVTATTNEEVRLMNFAYAQALGITLELHPDDEDA